jgi:hypothetical protein
MTPGERYDFRHCWTLNLSMRYVDLAQAGFFDPRFRPYGYEDLELGFRLNGPQRRGIVFEPAAEVVHRHPMTFDAYLDREELLGVMLPVVHDVNPDLYRALAGEKAPRELAADFRDWLQMDRASHAWIYRRMNEWCGLTADVLGDGDARQRLLMTLYQMHVPLKRAAFRLGFLRGMELRDDARWKERIVRSDWRSLITA